MYFENGLTFQHGMGATGEFNVVEVFRAFSLTLVIVFGTSENAAVLAYYIRCNFCDYFLTARQDIIFSALEMLKIHAKTS